MENAEVLVAEAKEMILRSHFFEAGKKIEKVILLYERSGNFKAEAEARLLLDHAYFQTMQADKREANLKKLLGEINGPKDLSSETINLIRLKWAENLLYTRRSQEAEIYLTTYLPHVLTSEDFRSLAHCYFLLAECYHKQMNYLEAGISYAKSLEICETKVPDSYEFRLQLLKMMAIFNLNIGHLDRHDKLFQKRIQLIQDRPVLTAFDSLEIANSHYYLLRSEWRGGDFKKLLSHVEQVYQMYRSISISHQDHLGRSLGWMSLALMRLNEYEKAAQYTRQQEVYLQNPSNREMSIYSFYGQLNSARSQRGNKKNQQAKLAKILEISEKWKIPPSDAYVFGAEMELSDGKPHLSLKYAEMALKSVYEENYWINPSKTKVAYAHESMALALVQLENYELAIYHFHKALLAYTTDFRNEDVMANPGYVNEVSNVNVMKIIQQKGNCFQQLANREPRKRVAFLNLAHSAFLSASEVADKLRTVYFGDDSRLNLSKQTHENLGKVVATGYQLYEFTNDTLYLNTAFRASEKAKASLLQELFANAAAMKSAKVPSGVLQKGQTLKRELAYYKGALLQETYRLGNPDSERIAWLKKNVFQLREELSKWETGVASSFPDFSTKISPKTTITLSEVGQLLEEKEAIIEFFVNGEDVYEFFVSANATELRKVTFPDDFEKQVDKWKRTISDPRSLEDSLESYFSTYTTTGRRLYQTLIAPVLEMDSSVSKLLIIPDGALFEIPYEALLTDTVRSSRVDFTKLPYLIRNFQVRYAPSVSSLITIMNRETRLEETRCLAVAPGGEVGDTVQIRGDLQRLRSNRGELVGAQREVFAISQLGIPGEYCFGNSATEERFKTLGPKFNLLHLALHGDAHPEEPLMSNLKFSSAKDSSADNTLFAYELPEIQLDADLVVLSACETGVGKYETGEGNMSLGWYFMANGVDAVVATLWEVEDKLSAELIKEFYGNLVRSMSSGEALHHAKLAMLNRADSRSAHPYYWAGYVASGASKPLKLSQNSQFWMDSAKWLVVFVVLLGIALAFRFKVRKASANK